MDQSRPKTLAEHLGVVDPRHPEILPTPDPGVLTPKRFCQAVLNSPEFRTYILNGLVLGTLPPQIILRIADVGWGKPVERIEMRDTTPPLEKLSVEDLETRALMIAEKIRRLRTKDNDNGSVH